MSSLFRTIMLAGVVAIILPTLVGCKSTDPVVPGEDTVNPYPNVVLDPKLEDKLVSSEPTIRMPTQTEPLRISVPVRSITQHPLNLQYRVIYFGDFGKQTNDYPVWKDFRVMGRTRYVISDNAIDLDAVDWNIEIRPAR